MPRCIVGDCSTAVVTAVAPPPSVLHTHTNSHKCIHLKLAHSQGQENITGGGVLKARGTALGGQRHTLNVQIPHADY